MNPARHWRDFTLRAERLQDHVAKHVRLGFRLADLTDVDELLDQRLVLRRESNVIFTNDVTAAVADLDEIEIAVANRGPRERRAHARTTRVLLALLMNREVRVVSRVFQTLDKV